MMKMKSGFTLAEVLTTLMVIGVVAAMTIPTLMNSTGEQQAKVAAKKAASILSQGVQLLIAKEEECPNLDDDKALAQCMANVISGTVTGNTIATPDGMVYAFFVSDKAQDVEEGEQSPNTLSSVCGSVPGANNGKGNCGVLVDTNGYNKGIKTSMNAIDGEGDGAADNGTKIYVAGQGFKSTAESGTDRVGFSLSATGVKPIAVSGGLNNAWKYTYGNAPGESDYAATLCCMKNKDGAGNYLEFDKCPSDNSIIICTPISAVKCDTNRGYEEVSSDGGAGKKYVEPGGCPDVPQ